MGLKFKPSSFFALFKARLSQRITLLVFLSIVVVEAMLLIPSVYRREQELLRDIQRSAMSMIFGTLAKPDLQGSPQQLLRQLQSLEQDPTVLGATLYQANGQKVGQFGKPPVLSFQDILKKPNAKRYDRIHHEYSAAWPTDVFQGKYTLIVRYDTQSVKSEIIAFIARIVGLVVIISVFVTIATMIVLHSILIIPIMQLRSDLLKAANIALQEGDRPDHLLQFNSLSFQGRDELGEVMTAFGQMYRQISDAIRQRQTVETELRLSEEKFSKAFRASPNPVMISTVNDGQVFEANDSFLALFDVTAQEIADQTLREMNLWADPFDRVAMIETLQNNGIFRNKERLFHTRLGETKTVLYSAELINIGESGCILAVINDITERKAASVALQESEERFRTLIEQAVDALFVINVQGRIVDVNQRACQSLGYSRKELLQLTFPEIQCALTAEEFNALSASLKLGIPVTIEGIHQRKDKTTLPVEARMGIFESRGERFILALVRDTTERKQAEKAMARLAEIGELAAMIVHEIRNPLTTVLMGLNYFKRQNLSSGAQARADLALDEAERLGRLLNEILLYTKQPRLDLSPLELNEFIAEILAPIQTMPSALGRQIQFTPTPEKVYIQGDRDKLRQVLINLISNACEAVPSGETISCQIQLASLASRVSIQIHNGGEPIPPEVLPKLTQPFFTTKPSGNGLGLAITKRIAEAHGGTFLITSSADVGTTVILDLPRISEILTPLNDC